VEEIRRFVEADSLAYLSLDYCSLRRLSDGPWELISARQKRHEKHDHTATRTATPATPDIRPTRPSGQLLASIPAGDLELMLTLAAKEGISLINGTQAMLAIGCLELDAAQVLTETADVICAMTLDALRGTPRAFDERIHAARPHAGQMESAARLRGLLEGSEIRQSHIACRRVQDAYSLRCAPQVHGAVRDTVATASAVFAIELNSATDNPLVFDGEILSGGNFHGEPLAFQLDFWRWRCARSRASRNGAWTGW
jgi:hypothetical protein